MASGIQTMDAWVETFGTMENGKKTLTTSNQSLVVSILSAGVSRDALFIADRINIQTFFGALAAGPVADRMGRRYGMIFSCMVFSLGVGVSHSPQISR